MVLAVLVEYESQLTAWPSLRYSRGTQAPPKPKLQKTSLTTFLIFINIIFLCCSTIVKHVLCMWWHSDGCQEERLGSRGGFLVTLESSCQMSPPPASDSKNSNPSNAVLAFRRREPYIFKKSNYTKKIENLSFSLVTELAHTKSPYSSSPSRSQKCRPTTGQSLCLTKCNIGWKKSKLPFLPFPTLPILFFWVTCFFSPSPMTMHIWYGIYWKVQLCYIEVL